MRRSSIRGPAAVAVVLWAGAAWAQPSQAPTVDTRTSAPGSVITSETALNLGFTSKGRPATFRNIVLVPPGVAENAMVPAGTTGAEGRISLDTAIGGIPPGKPVKLTERTCRDGTNTIFVGDVPAKKDGCDDDIIGGLLWGAGSYTFKLDGGGLLTPRNGAIAAGTVLTATLLAANGSAPAASGTTNANSTNNTSTTANPPPAGTAPTAVILNGRYVGLFTLATGNCSFFNPSFNGTLVVTARDDGSADFEIVESIIRRYLGRAQVTGATTGTGTGTGGGALPGNTAFTSVVNIVFSGDQATVEEILTLLGSNCSVTFRATAMRQR